MWRTQKMVFSPLLFLMCFFFGLLWAVDKCNDQFTPPCCSPESAQRTALGCLSIFPVGCDIFNSSTGVASWKQVLSWKTSVSLSSLWRSGRMSYPGVEHWQPEQRAVFSSFRTENYGTVIFFCRRTYFLKMLNPRCFNTYTCLWQERNSSTHLHCMKKSLV